MKKSLQFLDWKNNLKEDIIKKFTKGSVTPDDFPHIPKENFEKSLEGIRNDLWELFPKLKHEDPFPYNKKTNKYDSLNKWTEDK